MRISPAWPAAMILSASGSQVDADAIAVQVERAHRVQLKQTRQRVIELGGRARDDRPIGQLVADMDPQDTRVRR